MTMAFPWVWRHSSWPAFTYDAAVLADDLADAYRKHGIAEGKAAAIGLTSTSGLALDAIADEAQATAAIEGERLSTDVVRSSVMRHLGLTASAPTDRSVDGLVAVIEDATRQSDQALDEDQLCRWQSALFPGGASGIRRIAVGRYRDHDDPMQIVSGRPGRERVHYEAPPSNDVPAHMRTFIEWFNASAPSAPLRPSSPPRLDGLARAAIAHLWFESIHPFEDGNGRIGRAIADRAISQYLPQPVRLFSLSRQLQISRAQYYEYLNASQRGATLDVTPWVQWFVRQCAAAFGAAITVIDQALEKRRFWDTHAGAGLNERQRKVLQRLLDAGDGGFLGGLNAEKYIKLTGASKATATRDLAEMVYGKQLWTAGVGKAVRYFVNVPGWRHQSPMSTPSARLGLAGDRASP